MTKITHPIAKNKIIKKTLHTDLFQLNLLRNPQLETFITVVETNELNLSRKFSLEKSISICFTLTNDPFVGRCSK